MLTSQDVLRTAAHLLATSTNASYTPKMAVQQARELAAAVEAEDWMAAIERDVADLPRVEDIHGFARPEASGVAEEIE